MNFIQKLDFDWIEFLKFYNRPCRAKFIPKKVWSDLDDYRSDLLGLKNYFKKWRTKIVFLKEPTKSIIYKNYITIGGEYDPIERRCALFLYTSKPESHEFTDKSWNSFKKRIVQTFMHELIHFMQFDRRDDNWSNYVVSYKHSSNPKKESQRKYLATFDEIQAYAHCVLIDFKFNRPKTEVKTLLSNCKSKRLSSTLNYFLKSFEYDFDNNMATHKLIQQIDKWNNRYNKVLKS